MKAVKKFKIFVTIFFGIGILVLIGMLSPMSSSLHDKEDDLVIGYLIAIGIGCIVFTWVLNPSKYDIHATYRPLVNDLISGKKHWYIVSMDLEHNVQLDVLSPEEIEKMIEKSGGMRSIPRIGNDSVKKYLIQGNLTVSENETTGIRHVDEVQKIINLLDAELEE